VPLFEELSIAIVDASSSVEHQDEGRFPHDRVLDLPNVSLHDLARPFGLSFDLGSKLLAHFTVVA
jgi:hypothetical protein